jgi:hypothetical protein
VNTVAVTKRAKAAITRVGTVKRLGSITAVTGWTLGLCLRGCDCHRDPHTSGLTIRQGANGQISLAKYRVCDCCEPWTWQELQGFLTDLAAIQKLPTAEGQLS